ncbi:hypothetical protein J6590_055682 [Homalodisca vitripennis]|nr:hypothetical protein J6590_055682 [Homalodisca vitripennis]
MWIICYRDQPLEPLTARNTTAVCVTRVTRRIMTCTTNLKHNVRRLSKVLVAPEQSAYSMKSRLERIDPSDVTFRSKGTNNVNNRCRHFCGIVVRHLKQIEQEGDDWEQEGKRAPTSGLTF